MREKERAEKAAERAAKIAAQNTKKATQKAQSTKHKAPRAASSSNKRQKQVRGGRDTAEVQVVPSVALPQKRTRSHKINLPRRFE